MYGVCMGTGQVHEAVLVLWMVEVDGGWWDGKP